jgi:hypothetical protein
LTDIAKLYEQLKADYNGEQWRQKKAHWEVGFLLFYCLKFTDKNTILITCICNVINGFL